MHSVPARICTRCGKKKSFAEFVKNRAKPSGIGNICHSCANAEAREKRKRKKYGIGISVPLPGFRVCINCGKMTPYDMLFEYNKATGGIGNQCKICARQKAQIYEKANEEKFQRTRKQFYREHRVRFLASVKRYAEEHPEIGERARRGYYARNGQKWRQYGKNRRARKLNAPGKYTKDDVLSQYESQRGLCYWCSQPMPAYHADHYYPLTRGGTNWPDNIVVSCPFCNQSKSDRIPYEEWQPPNPLHNEPLPKTERRFRSHQDSEVEDQETPQKGN